VVLAIIEQDSTSDYVHSLPESVQRKLKEQNGLWYKDKCVVVPDELPGKQ